MNRRAYITAGAPCLFAGDRAAGDFPLGLHNDDLLQVCDVTLP